MSTYTQDITHLIGKINTNLPDNDTQAITAARIRDAMGAVAYNYDLYVLKSQLNQELGSYVLKTDLDTAGYVTASQLEGLVTDQELQEGMQSVLDDAYAYVVEKISDIPVIDPSLYVSKTELSSMGYITENDLPDMSTYVTESQLQEAGYATKTYVADYVAEHTPTPDLSAYVTKTELSEAGYLTAVPSEYVTDTELSSMGYITEGALGDYVTETELSQAGYLTSIPSEYVTESEIATMGYITDTELSNVLSTASYVTQNELSNAGYITNSDLSQASYVTQQTLSGMGYITTIPSEYVTESQLQSTLTAYITDTELSAMGYITSSYAETYYLDYTSFGHYTSWMQDTLVDANILITDPETGDWIPDSMASQTYVAEYVASYAPTPDLSTYVTKTELSNMGYITSIPSDYATYDAISAMGYITSSDLPDMSAYATITYVETYYATNTALGNKQDTLVSGTNIKTINNESLLGSGDITIQGGGGSPDYSHVLTFTATQANSSVTLNRLGSDTSLANAMLQYSTDNGASWTDYTLGTSLALAAIGDTVKLKGTNATLAIDGSNYHKFTMTGKISASGDITSLFNETGGDMAMPSYGCYRLFYSCSSLTKAPKLPATTLASYCYNYMFRDCTSLTDAPELPATTLADSCYSGMFFGCTYLTKAPKLPATTLTQTCYGSMFQGCTRLTTPPELPATTLATACYSGMFWNCTSLTKAPELPATTLAVQCYENMFNTCTSLTTAPDLPATSLSVNCYSGMFYKCSSLKYIKAMFTSSPALYLTQSWVSNVAATGVFVKNNAATWTDTGVNAVPSGWTVYKAVSIDTDDVPESYVEDNGKSLQIVNGLWTKVTVGGSPDYSNVLKFTAAQTNSTIKLQRAGSDTSLSNAVLKYSTDNGASWTDYTLDTTITLTAVGDSVMFKGTNAALGISNSNYHKFVMTGKISASGDVTSLLNEFGGDIPMTTYGCYYLFNGCSSLTTPPNLPSTTLADNCYQAMFQNCTSLTEAPKLPAKTLTSYCYYAMFWACSSLTKAPELPAMTLAINCYQEMFFNCTALTEAPELPATTLTNSCYYGMFQGCNHLTKAPDILPAMTLTQSCYYSMFRDCTALTKAPVLPATDLTTFGIYRYMFYGCTHLNYIKAMILSDLSSVSNNIFNWMYSVPANGVFVMNANATWDPEQVRGASGVPSGWTVYKTVSIDTDDFPESYVEDNGKGLQVVNGVWEKVSGLLTSANLIYDSTTNTLTINV